MYPILRGDESTNSYALHDTSKEDYFKLDKENSVFSKV